MKPDNVLYFSYGSNLWSHRMHIMNKTATFYDVGLLKGYYLTFMDHAEGWNGAVATIEKGDLLQTIHGVVWSIPKNDIHLLDKQESGYDAVQVPVKTSSGNEILCRTYLYRKSEQSQRQHPSVIYKAVIVAGALEHNLPECYVHDLLQVQDNGRTQSISINVDFEMLRNCLKGHMEI